MEISKRASTALYGAEACIVSRKGLGKYRTAIVAALGGGRSNRSCDFVFATQKGDQDYDPEVEILIKRVVAIRRQVVKSQKSKDLILSFKDWPQEEIYPASIDENRIAGGWCPQQRLIDE